MSIESARGRAAQAWCTDKTSGKVMDAELCEEFAKILEEIWSKPWLGNATTRELIDEIKCRIGMDGKLDYRTVDSE